MYHKRPQNEIELKDSVESNYVIIFCWEIGQDQFNPYFRKKDKKRSNDEYNSKIYIE